MIYATLARLIKKIDECENNPENSSMTKVSEIFYQIFRCPQSNHLYTEVNIA